MFCSLDRIDALVSGNGESIAVQTDHRTAADVAAAPEISVLFALARVLLARRHLAEQGPGPGRVVYFAEHDPPGFLIDALAAVGTAVVKTPPEMFRPPPPSQHAPAQLADQAFAGLARRVCGRMRVSDPALALHALEAEKAQRGPYRKQEEELYWTRLLELSALAGEILRRKHGASWIIDEHGALPFGLQIDRETQTVVLLTNRARRFLAEGADQSLFPLVSTVEEVQLRQRGAAPAGPLLPTLRRRAEAEASGMLWRPLADGLDAGDDLPVIGYGNDSEHSISLLLRADGEARAEAVHAEALANLRTQKVETSLIESGGRRTAFVGGSFYAAEKLLDVDFVRDLHGQLGSALLAVGTPHRGRLIAAAIRDAGEAGILARMIADAYRDAGSKALSRAVLVVERGAVTGVARAAAEKPGLLKRWLGRN
jgi:hypothetical protein